MLKHKNTVQLHELISSINEENGIFIYMVFEYMEHDLTGILSRGIPFDATHVKCLNKQLFNGLAYMHAMNIIHRDMKGSNILLNSKGELKIAGTLKINPHLFLDFGLARSELLDQPKVSNMYTNRVVTLWYRPPELLLGSVTYDKSIDMWSAGCIFLELINLQPVFCGKDEVTQLDKIWQICGTPDVKVYPEIELLPWWSFLTPTNIIPNTLLKKFAR